MPGNKELIESLISEAQIKPWKRVWGVLNKKGEPNLDFSEEQIQKYIDYIFGTIEDIFNVFYERCLEVLDNKKHAKEIKKITKINDVLTNFREGLSGDNLKSITQTIKDIGYLMSLSHVEKLVFLHISSMLVKAIL